LTFTFQEVDNADDERHDSIDTHDTEVTVIGVDEYGIEYIAGAMESGGEIVDVYEEEMEITGEVYDVNGTFGIWDSVLDETETGPLPVFVPTRREVSWDAT
jgi:hypothetical protein